MQSIVNNFNNKTIYANIIIAKKVQIIVILPIFLEFQIRSVTILQNN